MQIAIIGAGAMGSLFGAMLSAVADVCLIDPFEAHVRTISEKGLLVEKPDGASARYSLFATTNPEDLETKADLAIIFTKSYKTETAAKTAKPLLKPDGLALTLQNGLGNLEMISEVLGRERSVAGVTSHGGTLVGPGHVRHAGEGPTYIADDPRNSLALKRIAKTFDAAGILTSLAENLDTLIWGKLVINVGINALAAILRVPNGVVGMTSSCRKIMANAVAEAENVAHGLGIELPYERPLNQVIKVCGNTAGNRASMLQDILRGARTEVDVINRAIVRKGKVLGIATPCNEFLSEMIEALEATSGERVET